MARYIDADNAIINFGFEYDDIPPTTEESIDFLKREKAVDAAPVVHGKWLSNDPYVGWRCSVCERNNDYAYRWNYDESENEQQDYFCPNCGAKMDGERRADNENL